MSYYITMSGVGIIAGSGLYEMPGLAITNEQDISTPYGAPSAPYVIGTIDDIRVVFLQRHGAGHDIAPHAINYRANLWGFRELGIERIISINAAGAISSALSPGDLVVLDQVIDFTQGARTATYAEQGNVVHVDFTEPYCPEMRAALIRAAATSDIPLTRSGTYVCVNGPRLESRAEIQHFRQIGADLVGMTGMPEAALARELAICFSALSVTTNYAAGLTGQKLTTTEVVEMMHKTNGTLMTLLGAALSLIPSRRTCACKDALEGSKISP